MMMNKTIYYTGGLLVTPHFHPTLPLTHYPMSFSGQLVKNCKSDPIGCLFQPILSGTHATLVF